MMNEALTEYNAFTRRPDPTPEEIAERAAEIRAGWSEFQLRRSLGVAAPVPVELTVLPDPEIFKVARAQRIESDSLSPPF